MKQYDKIFVPTDSFTNLMVKESTPIGKINSCNVERKDNVIIINTEELKEIWQAGMSRVLAMEHQYNPVTFDQFLQSKGINSLTP